jgi:hypothetical protein
MISQLVKTCLAGGLSIEEALMASYQIVMLVDSAISEELDYNPFPKN